MDTQYLETYRFVKPIIYRYKNENILLGLAFLYYDVTSINGLIKTSIEIILTSSIVILLLATLVAYFIGSRFTSPILDITKASESISKGDLKIRLNITTNDELEDLAYHFNAMVLDLQERKKMQKFVSNSTMNMIQKDKKKEMILGGEKRTLTLLFSDIRNSTALSEKESASDVIGIVNFYLNLQAKIIKEFGGDIDKFIGDEVMASFNGDDAVTRALKCSLKIQAEIKSENTKRKKSKKTICEVGIGINSGEVIVGNVGSEEHMDFTAVGLAVNIASRLCSIAKEGDIIIAKDTYKKGECKHDTLKEASFNVKGLSYPIKTFIISRKEL